MSSLLQTINAAISRRAASEEPDPEMENEDETAEGEETDPEAEGEETDPEAEGEEDDPEAEDEETDPEAEGEEDKPYAKARRAGAKAERARILSILGHPKAEAQPKLATRMIMDGTSAVRAKRLLSAITGTAAPAASLAGRMAAHRARPGADGVSKSNESPLIAAARQRRAHLKKGN